MMFIGDYPAIHYGSELYIIQHNRNFRLIVVSLPVKQSHHSTRKGTINLHGKSDYSYQTTQFYVNTSEAEMKCILDKIQSCSNFREAVVYDQYGRMKKSCLRIDSRLHVRQIKPAGNEYYAEPNDKIELICDH